MADPRPIDRLKAALSKAPDPMSLTIEQQRSTTEQLAISNPPATDIAVTETTVGGVAGAWIETPQSLSHRVIVYIHGGAFVAGSFRSHSSLAGELARRAKARVFSVGYRLAPEARFPAAHNDCFAAYAAIAETPEISDLALAGDSAGGGLALSTMMTARDKKIRAADAAFLISPWVDLTCRSESYDALQDDDPIISRNLLKKMAGLYLDDGDPRNPSASPLFGDFHDLPKILIQVGACEVLLDDSRALARSAQAAEVDVTLDVWPDMIHVWHGFTKFLPEACDALGRAGDHLNATWKT